MENFDNVMSSSLPREGAFVVDLSKLSKDSLDPGQYIMASLDSMFKRSIELQKIVDIIYPHSLNAGSKYVVITLSDYRTEGILPKP